MLVQCRDRRIRYDVATRELAKGGTLSLVNRAVGLILSKHEKRLVRVLDVVPEGVVHIIIMATLRRGLFVIAFTSLKYILRRYHLSVVWYFFAGTSGTGAYFTYRTRSGLGFHTLVANLSGTSRQDLNFPFPRFFHFLYTRPRT